MRYLTVTMPDWFVLEVWSDGRWIDQAFCCPGDFSREADGSYLRWDGGSGLWLRAVRLDPGGVIGHLDGSGKRHRCRLVPLPNRRYPGLTARDRPS